MIYRGRNPPVFFEKIMTIINKKRVQVQPKKYIPQYVKNEVTPLHASPIFVDSDTINNQQEFMKNMNSPYQSIPVNNFQNRNVGYHATAVHPKAEEIDTSELSESDDTLDEYVLFINGELFGSGTLDQVQQEVESMIFGTGENANSEILPENISVYKKMTLKVGVVLS